MSDIAAERGIQPNQSIIPEMSDSSDFDKAASWNRSIAKIKSTNPCQMFHSMITLSLYSLTTRRTMHRWKNGWFWKYKSGILRNYSAPLQMALPMFLTINS